MEKRSLEAILQEIEAALPVVVFRNWARWGDVIPLNPRTIANDDCLGIGPREKIYLGRVAGYPKAAFMEYLRRKARMA